MSAAEESSRVLRFHYEENVLEKDSNGNGDKSQSHAKTFGIDILGELAMLQPIVGIDLVPPATASKTEITPMFQKALVEAKTKKSLNMRSIELWMTLAYLHEALGQHKCALDHAYEALNRDAHNSKMRILGALASLKLDIPKAGLDLLEPLILKYDKQAISALENSSNDRDASSVQQTAKEVSEAIVYTLHGICCCKNAFQCDFSRRSQLQKTAVGSLKRSHALSLHHPTTAFLLACVYADIRDISSSLKLVKFALKEEPTPDRWLLFALLQSTLHAYDEALSAVLIGLKANRKHIALHVTRISILIAQKRFDDALIASKEAVELYFHAHEILSVAAPSFDASTVPRIIVSASTEHSSVMQAPVSSAIHAQNCMLSAELELLLALSRLYIAYHLQKKAVATEQYMASVKSNNTQLIEFSFRCCQQAIGLSKFQDRAAVHVQLGRICLAIDDTTTAIEHFDLALCYNPHYVAALTGMATTIYSNQSSPSASIAAAGYLRRALAYDASLENIWADLGRLQALLGQSNEAIDSLLVAFELQQTAPILPFWYVNRSM